MLQQAEPKVISRSEVMALIDVALGPEAATRTTRRERFQRVLHLWAATAKKSPCTLSAVHAHAHAHVHAHVCHTEGAHTRTRLSAISPPTDRSATLTRAHGACRRGERVQKAGAIGGGAALSTRGAAPGRCDDACRTYRHHISTVEGFEVCLRGRRRLALDRAG